MDSLSRQAISYICKQSYNYLMRLQNVNGVGVGYKYINGKNTKKLCIHVLVEKKHHYEYVHRTQMIPKFYNGILTDVIEVGELRTISLKNKIRPLQGGYGISTSYLGEDYSGTLGCIVSRSSLFKKEYFILSNNHVIAGENNAPKGNPILQPSILDGGSIKNDVVANLSDFIQLKYRNSFSNPINYVDCAIGKIKNKSLASKIVSIIGSIRGVAEPKINSAVKKVGQSTGLTEGVITTMDLTMKAKYGKNIALFKGQTLALLKSSEGDSGSIVLNSVDEAVGLVFTASDKATVFNDIGTVLKYLNVKIYN